MKKDTIMLQEYVPVQDSEGNISNEWVDVVALAGTLLPIGSEMAARQYGYSENVSYQFFYKGTNIKVRTGNRVLISFSEYLKFGEGYTFEEDLQFGGDTDIVRFYIVHIADYKKMKVLLLDTFIGKMQIRGG
ncbi:hypothetical protein [Petroclostridium sp. X23]|uniref:hypothetical protein n=1 Tax=Petroclostridium sp. X23 TaxID=3045146 RepID=UPI0024AD2297|nr:hypothetical protein [Petroclostridium sp. X23]WHH59164.1 hypothetical protein QKW49_25820 [Petroclostridium sp. X23]